MEQEEFRLDFMKTLLPIKIKKPWNKVNVQNMQTCSGLLIKICSTVISNILMSKIFTCMDVILL